MKCPRCQSQNREGVRFCEDCGGRLVIVCPSCGAELREGVRLEGFVDRVATLRTRDGRRERVRVDFLVGADGARSTVARLVGSSRPR